MWEGLAPFHSLYSVRQPIPVGSKAAALWLSIWGAPSNTRAVSRYRTNGYGHKPAHCLACRTCTSGIAEE